MEQPIALGYVAGGQTYLFDPNAVLAFAAVKLEADPDERFFLTQLEFTEGVERILRMGETPQYYGLSDAMLFTPVATEVVVQRKVNPDPVYPILAAKKGERVILWHPDKEQFFDYDTRIDLIDFRMKGRKLQEQHVMFERAMKDRPGYDPVSALFLNNELYFVSY